MCMIVTYRFFTGVQTGVRTKPPQDKTPFIIFGRVDELPPWVDKTSFMIRQNPLQGRTNPLQVQINPPSMVDKTLYNGGQNPLFLNFF